jgi:hypothetical protein
VFVCLEKLAGYCVENAKSIRIDIGGFGVLVSAHSERNDHDSGDSEKPDGLVTLFGTGPAVALW